MPVIDDPTRESRRAKIRWAQPAWHSFYDSIRFNTSNSTFSMEITVKLTSSLLALASLGVSLAPLQAAPVPDPVSGDLFVGFRVSGGAGGSQSYIVKLGLDTSFSTTPGTSFTLNLGDLGADLEAQYGANWSTRNDLFWGIFGTRTSASPIVYGSRERLDPDTPSTPWVALDLTARNSVDSQIGSVLNNIGGYRGSEATSNSLFGTFQDNSGQASSYNFQVATPGTTDFGSLSQWGSIEGSFANGADDTVLDLYRIAGSGVTQRGSFSIDDEGVISYFVVPEPASALILVAGTVMLIGARRHRSAFASS